MTKKIVETRFWDAQKLEKSVNQCTKILLSTVKIYPEHGGNMRKAWSKCNKICRTRSKYTSNAVKQASSTVQTYQYSVGYGQNISRARLKHASSTVETCVEHGPNVLKFCPARSKYTSNTVENYLTDCRNILLIN